MLYVAPDSGAVENKLIMYGLVEKLYADVVYLCFGSRRVRQASEHTFP